MKLYIVIPIRPYEAPDYLVTVTGRPLIPDKYPQFQEGKFTVLDTLVAGWGSCNAIIRTEDEEGAIADYLAFADLSGLAKEEA